MPTLIPIDHKGRAATFILKGANKKRTRKEFEEVKGEQQELTHDRIEFLKRVKRMRLEHTEMHNVLVDLSSG